MKDHYLYSFECNLAFWKAHKCKLISIWTRKTVWLLINNINMKKFVWRMFWTLQTLNSPLARTKSVYDRAFFFLFSLWNLPNVLISKAIFFSIAIYLPRVLILQKRQISLPVGYKAARPKTGDWERLWRHSRTPSLAKNRFLSHFLIVSQSIR